MNTIDFPSKTANVSKVTRPHAEPVLISYIRFSTPEQSAGFSEARQNREAEKWAASRGLTLRQYADRGLSGFTGENRKKGALSVFLEEIKAGKIPVGSVLAVENLDRLSREHPLDSIRLIEQILSAGITVVTTNNGAEYTNETLRKDQMKFQWLVFELGRASGESSRKSDLLGKSWDKKRQDAIAHKKPLGASCPGWIALENGKYVIRADRAPVVRQIFEWSNAGIGIHSVANKLNEACTLIFACETWTGNIVDKLLKGTAKKAAIKANAGALSEIRKWKAAGDDEGEIARRLNAAGIRCERPGVWTGRYVWSIIHDRACIGEYQLHKDGETVGDPIPGYFPAVIDAETFQTAQKSRKKTAGPLSKSIGNLFTGLIFDAKTGASVTYRAVSKRGRNTLYYLISSRQQGVVDIGRWVYPNVEFAILSTLEEIDWRELSGESRPAEERELAGKVAALEVQAGQLEVRCANLGESIAVSPLRTLIGQLEKAETQLAGVQAELEASRKALAAFQTSDLTMSEFEVPAGAFDSKAREVRLALRAEIARRVSRIELDRRDEEKRFQISIQFVNGVYRWIRVQPQYGKRPLVKAIAFHPPNPDAPDILAHPSHPDDCATEVA